MEYMDKLRYFEGYSSLSTRKRINGMSEGYRKRAKKQIENALRYLEQNNVAKDEIFFGIVDYLNSLQVKNSSRATICYNISKFLRYANLITEDDYKKLHQYYKHPVQVWSNKSITYDKVMEIIRETPNKCRYKLAKHRDPLILVTFATIGIRVSQLTGIKYKDVKVINDTLHLNIRKLKQVNHSEEDEYDEKIIPMDIEIAGKEVGDYYYDYTKYINNIWDTPPEYFFVNQQKEKLSNIYVTATIVKRVDKSITSHHFRHFVATRIAQLHNIQTATSLLGHASVQTTLRYVNKKEIQSSEVLAIRKMFKEVR